jgi:hypothetical protein
VYEVDRDGIITRVGGAWEAFARANGAPTLAGAAVVGRSLRLSIAESTTRLLYDALLVRVRGGRRVTVPFRCDGPAVRRFMELVMTPGPEDGVRFEAVLLSAEPRHPVSLLDASVPRSADLVKMCAWCRKVAVGERWCEVEEAVAALGLFGAPVLPAITHGICPACNAAVLAVAS